MRRSAETVLKRSRWLRRSATPAFLPPTGPSAPSSHPWIAETPDRVFPNYRTLSSSLRAGRCPVRRPEHRACQWRTRVVTATRRRCLTDGTDLRRERHRGRDRLSNGSRSGDRRGAARGWRCARRKMVTREGRSSWAGCFATNEEAEATELRLSILLPRAEVVKWIHVS